ncbi:alpha/beta hydrolase [Longispora fulva]|uniref:Pimeloyl-ACP methyl ester carboxylesterase n=1 Tax=Longispora fulva TaxID=619741 RepID=A0A8J7GP85_9ACTN|nr:alpha/beta hydrolase [Longispora fulva]MBG6136379.1 pimeloyl-ACP methyl ester carboxylesterase [Longispora fulva]GIG63448.1 alpha/beta hydrolase [Longispora fulva]
MAHVTANGVRLHVQRVPAAGATGGLPVVCLHGLVDSLASYYFTLAGPIADLGLDVVTYDLRGHGRSECPPHGYTVDDAVADLAGLLDALGIGGPVHLLGCSFGGTVAFAFAHRHPERVATLIVIESEPPTTAWAQRTAAGMREVEDLMLDDAFLNGQPDLARVLTADKTFAARQPDVIAKMAATVHKLDADTHLMREITAPEGLLDAEQVRAIRHPVLLIVGGESDLSTRTSDFTPLLADCTRIVVPGHGHLLLTSAPREVADLVVPWLHERRTASP